MVSQKERRVCHFSFTGEGIFPDNYEDYDIGKSIAKQIDDDLLNEIRSINEKIT